jgi:acyl dehydratase
VGKLLLRLGVLNLRLHCYVEATMSRYWQHIPNQAAGLGALGGLIQKAAWDAWKRARNEDKIPKPAALGMSVRRHVALPPVELQRDFVRFCGGDPSRYAGRIPPHLFSQWVLPVALVLAKRLPYPPLSVVNLGCSVRFDGILPAQGSVDVHCTLIELEEREDKVFLTLSLNTLYDDEARIRAELRLMVRLPDAIKAREKKKRSRELELVPSQARELAHRRLGRDAGLAFAELTGDFNPIHWMPAYAKMVGFKAPILQGFASFGIAYEALVQGRLSGRVDDVRRMDADFAAPLVLPRAVGVFSEHDKLWVADGAGGPAYMSGQVELR